LRVRLDQLHVTAGRQPLHQGAVASREYDVGYPEGVVAYTQRIKLGAQPHLRPVGVGLESVVDITPSRVPVGHAVGGAHVCLVDQQDGYGRDLPRISGAHYAG
jgi:hypothetical protein